METLYQEFKDIAEFRLIYIKEAHALSDIGTPVDYAREKEIHQATDLNQRCATAKRLIDDNQLTLPTLVDNMNNEADAAYDAHPDRVFLIRTDGRVGVSGAPGAEGFKPGLEQVEKWLTQFREDCAEPPLNLAGE